MVNPDIAIGILVFLGFVFSIVVHECAHALVASWCGDNTARWLGRITLNPVPHIDPFMSVILPAILIVTTGTAFGGAKPVPVNPLNLRRPARDMMWVALAGPVSNVILAIGFAAVGNLVVLLRFWDFELAQSLMQALVKVVYVNLVLAAFNMIPVPPLDGSRILAYFLPRDLAASMMSLERYGLFIVGFLVYSGSTSHLLAPVVRGTHWLINTLVVAN